MRLTGRGIDGVTPNGAARARSGEAVLDAAERLIAQHGGGRRPCASALSPSSKGRPTGAS
jgi:hypothetical protein